MIVMNVRTALYVDRDERTVLYVEAGTLQTYCAYAPTISAHDAMMLTRHAMPPVILHLI